MKLSSSTSSSLRRLTGRWRSCHSVRVLRSAERWSCANLLLVFEGKDKADRVTHAVEKDVQVDNSVDFTEDKPQSSPVHVEEVKEKNAV